MIKMSNYFLIIILTVTILSVIPVSVYAQTDAVGTKTGTVKDVPAAKPGEPTLQEISDTVGHNRIASNIMWTLIAGFLVMFMQTGFAMVETGFTRAKNVAHTMGMNFLFMPLVLPASLSAVSPSCSEVQEI